MNKPIQTKTIIGDNGQEITLVKRVHAQVVYGSIDIRERWVALDSGLTCSPSNDDPAEVFYENGIETQLEWRNSNGLLHRDGGLPSTKTYHKGKLLFEQWHNHGNYWRENDLPTRVYYDEYGQVTKQIWLIDTCKFHRANDLPAVIEYKDGKVIDQKWYKNGVEYFPVAQAEDDEQKATIADCPVCLEPKQRRVAYACQHATICQDCDTNLHNCPLCREPITIRIKLYQ